MKENAPELFEKSPDLLHHLVTIRMCLKDGIEKDGTGIRNDGMTEKNPFLKKKRENSIF